ncbi:topoisomerase DNA-binding C4 zinc finger domain-containing protein [Candidatus Parcubacteria bacterium]|nr:topoisomerase DNA-binding C4 zinc finger domain-containing protein [Candidatus Parcubacteria bacterium]
MSEKEQETCPKCGAPLGEVVETQTGKKLRRCSTGSWNTETRRTEGCDYVLWLAVEDKPLDEKCPQCGEPLVLKATRFGKKMKKCSKGGWDTATKKPTGCDYVEWINGTTEPLEEECPECGKPLVLFTTNKGKKLKKCSTQGWDREKREVTGCAYTCWLKPSEYAAYGTKSDTGEEFLPPEE